MKILKMLPAFSSACLMSFLCCCEDVAEMSRGYNDAYNGYTPPSYTAPATDTSSVPSVDSTAGGDIGGVSEVGTGGSGGGGYESGGTYDPGTTATYDTNANSQPAGNTAAYNAGQQLAATMKQNQEMLAKQAEEFKNRPKPKQVPKTCFACNGAGSCRSCGGRGFSVSSNYNFTTKQFEEKQTNCYGCGGSGTCRTCNGTGQWGTQTVYE